MRLVIAAAACAVAGCSSYIGSARPFSPAALDREAGWIVVREVPLLRQQSESDCGAAAIGMVVSFWTDAPAASIAAALRPAPATGIKAAKLREVAKAHGLASFLIRGELGDLERELREGRPVLVGLVKPHRDSSVAHYEVVVALHPAKEIVVTLDPDRGFAQNGFAGFLFEWKHSGYVTLIVARR